MQQLTFNIHRKIGTTFSTFYPNNNLELLACLRQWLSGQGESIIYLWGKEGSGRTHLLQACCQAASELQKESMLISLADSAVSCDILQSIENLSLICLDDVDAVLGQRHWEETILHLYNRARENQKGIIFTAQTPPRQLSCQLPDLQSRLAWGLIFHVNALMDEQKVSALQLRARHSGLILPREVGQYLLLHYSRDTNKLFEALEKLDHLSWQAKRRLTIPFVKEVFQL